MSNEEKTIRSIHGKVLLVPHLDKFLTAIKETADAIGLDQFEFMIVTNLEMLRTTLQLAKEEGFTVDLDGVCNALKREVYGGDE